MKIPFSMPRAFVRAGMFGLALTVTLFTACSPSGKSGDDPSTTLTANDPDRAWEEVLLASTPPNQPAEWGQRAPTPQEQQQFVEMQKGMISSAIEKASAFYRLYPTHANAQAAKMKHHELLNFAVAMGIEGSIKESEALEESLLNDALISPEEKFRIRLNGVHRAASSRESDGRTAMFNEFEEGVRRLQKDYPDHPEIYESLMVIASNRDVEEAAPLAEEILKSTASTEVKEAAAGILKKKEMLGQPFELKFTAVDGRQVDSEQWSGKVVLLDFWATWCGPCVMELPNLKAAYEKLNSSGFEIVGISFDQDRAVLEKFVEKEKLPWPHYFDGKGWDNELGRQHGIGSIPALWLVDKKGLLRDLNARENLIAKVEKLLAE